MLKLGVTSPAGLERPRTWLGREKHVGALLLPKVQDGEAADARRDERILRRLQLADGTWRESAPGRLRALDRAVLAVLERDRPRGAPLDVFDLAASSGTTSVEFYHALRERFRVDFVASDRTREVWAVRTPGSRLTAVIDADGHVLQYVLGRFVLPGQGRESLAYPVNHVLRAACAAIARTRLCFVPAHAAGEELCWTTLDGYEVMRIPLLASACRALMRRDPHFRYEVVDILRPLGATADVIRAMNILNRSYLSDEQIATALRHCLAALRPSGLLVVGRSPADDPAAVRATVLEKTPFGLETAARLGGGSEIEELIPARAS